MSVSSFAEVWALDFEFIAAPGERPRPVCMVAEELKSGRQIRLWEDELLEMAHPPFPTGARSLFVSYYASAELGCFLALGWQMPVNIVDLFVEFRNLTNGKPVPSGNGLLGALIYFGLDSMAPARKDAMRDLVLSGGPWSASERCEILKYCSEDVRAIGSLLASMGHLIDLPRALLRGKYMTAVANIEAVGVPIDAVLLDRLRRNWTALQEKLIQAVDAQYGIYEGRAFKAAKWASWVSERGIPWPRLSSGSLVLDDKTFKDMARVYPSVEPIRQLRATLAELRLNKLTVGGDHRNRCLISPFGSKTGRNQPSNSKFIFGQSAWLRGLIKPESGMALAYIDWSQQEFGIAAALSGDPAMLAAYQTGDPYLNFAIQAGAAPFGATKASHGAIREQFKACALGVQYSMGEYALASRIGRTPAHARELLALHRRVYPVFWNWIEGALEHSSVFGRLDTVYGWRLHTTAETKVPALLNYPMQSNGAEMLRLACCLAVDRGIRVCAPVHDALLIEAPVDEVEEAISVTQASMAEASRRVLGCLELTSDVKVIRSPDRYEDDRGKAMWKTVMGLLHEVEQEIGIPC